MLVDFILHKANGTDTVELNKSIDGYSVVLNPKLHDVYNQVSYVEFDVAMSMDNYIEIGDWIEVDGKKYYSLTNFASFNARIAKGGTYNVRFYSPEQWLYKANMYATNEIYSGGVYSWERVDNTIVTVGNLESFGRWLCWNTNAQQNTRMFKLGNVPTGMNEQYEVLDFNPANCLSALYSICKTYKVRYEVVPNTEASPDSQYIINFYDTDEVFPVTFKYEEENGLYKLELTGCDEEVYTQFEIAGSTENIPSSYRDTRLRLSESISALSILDYPDLYDKWGRSIKILTYENIKPTRTGTVTDIVVDDIYSFIDSSLIGATWSPVGGTIQIVEGPLMGFSFECDYFNSANGRVHIKPMTESNGMELPSADLSYYRFTAGATPTRYNVVGIALPNEYIEDAEARLLAAAMNDTSYYSDIRASYSLAISGTLLEEGEYEINAGVLVPIQHLGIGLDRSVRVQSITYDLSKPKYYDIEEIQLSDFRQEGLMDMVTEGVRKSVATLKDVGYTNKLNTFANSVSTIKQGIAKSLGYESWEDFMEKTWNGEDGSWEPSTIIVDNLINSDLINVNTLIAREAFVGTLLTNSLTIGKITDTAAALDDAMQIGGRNLLILNPIFWQRGTIDSATGVVESSTTRLANIIGNEIGGAVPYVVELYSPHNIFLFFYDENDNYLGFNGWLTERTFGVTPAGTKKVKFVVAKSDNSTIVVDDILDVKIKLERGNKPTDWTPAPEDVDADIDAAQSAAESYALAKANLAETTAKAYADGVVSDEEARAIADATAKANAAKAAAEAAAKAYTDTGLGTKQNADERIDNIISTSGLPYRADLVIYGESNKYYPVYIFGGNQDLIRTIKIWRVYHEQAPDDWYSSTHKGSLMLTWKGNFGGWGGAVYRHTIEELACEYTELMAYCQHACHYMAYCFHLRGGGATGAVYHFASDQPFGTPWTGGTAPAVYYNGASDVVFPHDNIAYRVTAFEPLTSVNSTFLNSIKLAKQASVDAAASAAAAAQSTANAASTAASNAQTSANTANNLLSDIANDNKFTPLEKQETKKEWDAIVSEKTKNDSQADTFGVSKTAYGTAYTTLSNYITPLLSNLTTTSDITGTTFRSTFKAYYDARTDLLNAIAAKARTLANTAQATADNAASAAAAAVTTAASDATSKMNAAKDAIAQEAGYTDFADMASKAALTVNGLLNSQVINVDDLFANTAFVAKLAALEAFINNLVAKRITTDIDDAGAYVEIETAQENGVKVAQVRVQKTADVYAALRYVNGVYVEFINRTATRQTQMTANNHSACLLDANGSTLFEAHFNPYGLEVWEGVWGVGTQRIILQYIGGIIDFVLNGLPTEYNTNSVNRVWKDSHGYLKIGNGAAYAEQSHNHTKSQITDFPSSMPASDVSSWAKAASKPSYSASEVGALPTNTIQYFTQAQWAALTQAQKDAVPLALVQE